MSLLFPPWRVSKAAMDIVLRSTPYRHTSTIMQPFGHTLCSRLVVDQHYGDALCMSNFEGELPADTHADATVEVRMVFDVLNFS